VRSRSRTWGDGPCSRQPPSSSGSTGSWPSWPSSGPWWRRPCRRPRWRVCRIVRQTSPTMPTTRRPRSPNSRQCGPTLPMSRRGSASVGQFSRGKRDPSERRALATSIARWVERRTDDEIRTAEMVASLILAAARHKFRKPRAPAGSRDHLSAAT
jgi:hypothetical protein